MTATWLLSGLSMQYLGRAHFPLIPRSFQIQLAAGCQRSLALWFMLAKRGVLSHFEKLQLKILFTLIFTPITHHQYLPPLRRNEAISLQESRAILPPHRSNQFIGTVRRGFNDYLFQRGYFTPDNPLNVNILLAIPAGFLASNHFADDKRRIRQ